MAKSIKIRLSKRRYDRLNSMREKETINYKTKTKATKKGMSSSLSRSVRVITSPASSWRSRRALEIRGAPHPVTGSKIWLPDAKWINQAHLDQASTYTITIPFRWSRFRTWSARRASSEMREARSTSGTSHKRWPWSLQLSSTRKSIINISGARSTLASSWDRAATQLTRNLPHSIT